jgi:hypothetical protein
MPVHFSLIMPINTDATLQDMTCLVGLILAFNQWVAGSSPARLTTSSKRDLTCPTQ